jgi:hypothetical protein
MPTRRASLVKGTGDDWRDSLRLLESLRYELLTDAFSVLGLTGFF